MANNDWLAKNHEDLYDQLEQTWTYLSDPVNRTRMGLEGRISVWLDTEFAQELAAFREAFTAWKDKSNRTPRKSQRLKETEGKMRPSYRSLYMGFLKENRFVTNEDLNAMGFPLRPEGHHPEPAPIPLSFPLVTIEPGSAGILIIHFRDSDSKGRAKPRGVHGVEIRWAILGEAPTDWSQLTNSSFDTRTPFRLSFDGYERGKHFYCALRWENTRGE
ncbi:MAG: hypothetical protein LBL13_13390, partial [Bacteroidales bacterium]|nr:hypothetical protein [Bacteroidales bacterium]